MILFQIFLLSFGAVFTEEMLSHLADVERVRKRRKMKKKGSCR